MKGGFSLVEVMVVLVVLGVLAMVAYPTYTGYITRTRRVEAQIAMVEAIQEEELYYSQHNSYLAFSADDPQPRMNWWVGAKPGASAYEIDARACPGRTIGDCVEVRARPGTARVDASFRDAECAVMTFNSVGERTASGTSQRCWP